MTENTQLEDDLGNTVWIPGEFKVAADSGTRVEQGIVIEDKSGNQFVWVPVGTYMTSSGEKTNNLSRRTFTPSVATEVSGDSVINSYYYGEGDSRSVAYSTIGAFKDSSTIKGGFYIGRYEAGTEIERTSKEQTLTTPLVKKNKYPYVYITRDQANTQSKAMYSGNSYVVSELISSYAWDTALNFICQTNSAGYILVTTNSTAYGNRGTGIKTNTGMYAVDKYSNICDMLGNCGEWTTECYSNSNYPCVLRGGYFYSNGLSAASRYNGSSYSRDFAGFRTQLYIK